MDSEVNYDRPDAADGPAEGVLPEGFIEDVRVLVDCESPSNDLSAISASARAVALLGRRILGVEPDERVVDGCTHVLWRLGNGPNRVLLLGHHDTVWPIGTIDDLPFDVAGDVMRGPGTLDMKVGIVMALHAAARLDPSTAISILITGDEEIGSATSKSLLEEVASEVDAVLVLESAGDAGELKTARKGMSDYEVTVHGRAAHAGLEPERGINAVHEAAHQAIRLVSLGDPETGTTVVPSMISGGSSSNTVAATARIVVDVRTWSESEQWRVDRAVRGIEPVLDGARLSVSGGPDRPPMENTGSARLFGLAREVADTLGLEPLLEAHVGGVSDGNLTAGMGIPTLDGLGAVGGGAHADDEHVRLDMVAQRIDLIVGMIQRLAHDPLSMNSAIRSPTTAVGQAGVDLGISGKIDASAIRRDPTPKTRPA